MEVANCATAPICQLSHSGPNSTLAATQIIEYNSNVFAIQLLNSFKGNNSLSYLCNSLRPDMIESFALLDSTVKPAICHTAGLPVAPQPESDPLKASDGAVQAAKNTASVIFAELLVAGALKSSEVKLLCAHAPNHVASLNAEHLNGSLVQSTLCKYTEPISIAQAKSSLAAWLSRYFTTVIESISNTNNWLDWLCKHLDVDGMDSAGLNGVGIQQQVCSDSTAEEPSHKVAPIHNR